MVRRRWTATAAFTILAALGAAGRASAQAPEIVLYASDVSTLQGNWTRATSSSAAGGQYLASADRGWSTPDAPLASPGDYFDATINAVAGTTYHIWLRLRAEGNSKWNESVWVQFSDAVDQNGSPIYRIGTTSALLVNLENCYGCGVSSWGWQDRAYWLNQARNVRFPSNGTRTMRVQTREDGAQIDQIVLSPSTYLTNAPGQVAGDNTIVSKPGGSAPSSSPFSGTPAAIPGTIQTEDFDNGANGTAYRDTTSGNSGGAYRQTDVDIESSVEGGSDVGWIGAGEWLNYAVNVSASGTYTASFRVASSGQGGTFHLEMNGTNVTGALTIPNTGGWQTWTTVSKSVSLSAGLQTARLVFDSGGTSGAVGNFNWMKFDATASPSGGASTPYTGTPLPIPGTIRAELFDNGGEGVAYHDSGPNNAGGAFRQTGVDIENASDGTYDIGWTAAGEWVNYSVNVASAGTHTVQLTVASVGGGTMHVGFNGSSSVWQAVSVPNTGGWQSWTTVSFQATLGAGQQLMTVAFDTGGTNFKNVAVVTGSAPSAPPPPAPTSFVDVPVVHWNIQVDDSSAAHARAAIATITSMNPQPRIVVLAEARGTQYNTYISELQARTGLTWNGVFQSHCPPGKWNGSSCTGSEDEGVAVLSSFPVLNTGSLYFPYADSYHSARVAVRAAINVNGITVQVFGVHLIPGNITARYSSMSMLRSWASNYSKPQLVGGDFNADPDQIRSAQGMGGAFGDATEIAGSGSTQTAIVPWLTMKLDYWFSDISYKALPLWAVVVNTGGVSDHYAVMATYRVTP